MAARFFGAQPDLVVAVTGTNGKTSVASFVRQIWAVDGLSRGEPRHDRRRRSQRATEYLAHTTPDPVKLHAHCSRGSRPIM